jgi:hypothetical protein
MKYQTLAAGWFLSGFLLAYLWQTSTEPRRKTRKAENDDLAGKKLTPFPRIDENLKQATG